jgi:Fe-S-cluster containining protein
MKIDTAVFMDKLFRIYGEIDSVCRDSADYYGFSCDGCNDNCCRTVFYHYTIVESFGLLEGFDKLPVEIKDESMRRGRDYLKDLDKHRGKEEELEMMCPLNYDGRCRIYEYRPLICRIHGFPGGLDHPVKGKQSFTGCGIFNKTFQQKWTHLIDRTPFYTRIANLEGQIRREMDYMMRFRKTIAEMLIERNLYDGLNLGVKDK